MYPKVVSYHPGRGTRLEVFIYRSISPPTTFGAVTRMTTLGAQGRRLVREVKKSLGINVIFPKHWIQMFHCNMEE